MKKRILAMMLVLPLLVAFAAMGFTRLISIAIPQIPEDIFLEYDQIDAIEFSDITRPVELKGYVIPQASGVELLWSSSDEGVAKIEGNRITYVSDGEVTITASLPDNSMSKSFKAYIIMVGDTPKFIKANHEYPSEKGENVIGLYDYIDSLNGARKTAHTEVINFSVVPSMSSQNVTVSGIPEGEYRIENSQILLTPSKAGKYTVQIQSETVSEAAAEMSFEVADSVNIYSYEDLVRATDLSEEGDAVALRVNLESEANLGRSNSKPMSYKSGEAHEYVTFESTYDTNFLKNSGKSTTLKAAIVFKDDVYGNGHTLNLHDFAYPSEVDPGTNIAIPGMNDVFAGEPLEFVTVAGQLTVFGQGNAGFMIDGSDITVDNVVLKNCNNVGDLSNLDYVGTVLEVVGDNVILKNSTVQNGRTVVRSFSNKNLLIENCLLAYGREFIYKQGSNNFVYPEKNREWGSIKNQLFDFDDLPESAKEGDSTATIRDTDFYTSGIFCIGMDTHFAGQYLYQWIGNNQSINNLAATSYKSTLNLEGDVRFYDWKIAKNLDSSILVKSSMEGIDLNIYDLLKNYDREYGQGTIFKTVKGVEYVHGGIAFFGGGYNLSEVYLNGTRVKCWKEDGYDGLNSDIYLSLSVSLSDNKIFSTLGSLLTAAAGTGDFSFCIYRNSYNGIGVEDNPFNN